MGTVSLENVHKRFGTVEAVRGLGFDADNGEFLVLLGPSGAGKTTTLKLIAGLETPDAGVVKINGRVMNAVPVNQRRVGMTFETYALYPNLTVYQNLVSPLTAPGVGLGKAEVEKRVFQIASMLRIEQLLDRRPAELSGGQKQRVSLGRTLVRPADVYLLDEPLSHVDTKVRHEMRAEFHRLESVFATTFIYVTHDYGEAMSLARRVVVINKGQALQIGTPEDIYERPATEFVARNVGSPEMNIVECAPVRSDGRLGLRAVNEARLSLPASNVLEHVLQGRATVKVGFRPQDIKISTDSVLDGHIAATVDVFEPLGNHNVVHLAVGKATLVALVGGEMLYCPGQPVSVWVEPERLHLFDVRDGARLCL